MTGWAVLAVIVVIVAVVAVTTWAVIKTICVLFDLFYDDDD